jgi:hypothetical protein
VVWVETVLDQQETALGVFLDIEGAFAVKLCVMLLLDVEVIAPLYGGLGSPWSVVWLWQPLMILL